MDLKQLVFNKLDFAGLSTLVSWAQKEGWNPGPDDANAFWATDPDGFYGYFFKDKLIAGGSIVCYHGDFGFMGFFIVKPEFRSIGIGRKLWFERRNTLLSRIKDGASIGMDGVVDMQPFYEKGGFKIAFRDERHVNIGSKFMVSDKISKIKASDLTEILEYDKKCFGFERPQFLKPWLNMPEVKTFKFVENDKIKGFAIVRKADVGYKICPLFADDPKIAEELYKACLNATVGEKIYLDIPVINKEALKLTKKYGTNYVFECARMYYGPPPNMAIRNVYGITTFELG